MKYLQPRRMDLFQKAITPKTKIDKRMITVEDALLFAEWASIRYSRMGSKWYNRVNAAQTYTTRELWELYQKFLGKKG